ncbi:MAG: flavodoxin domain-containing protein [Spirochaetes bacterium]|nr:flavodoxin domain-containing protein [Spirochaetota bacterium]
MKPIELASGIYSVGAVDWNARDFHGYSIWNGTTYNAYLIIDEQITLIDTVKKEFVHELITNISRIIDPKKIDQVISNHTEMDHSGGLFEVMSFIGKDKPVYCSEKGLENLSRHFYQKLNLKSIKDKDSLKIGKRTLTFLETRMLHWPDSMFTYVNEDKILFSSDAFGEHYAGPERFDDEIKDEKILPHAKKYYANILLPYSPLIKKLIERVTALGLQINMICPDHGIIWRANPLKIISAYAEWCEQKPSKKAVVVYDTMWHSTAKMAEAIVAGLQNAGIYALPMNLRTSDRSDTIAEVFDAGAVIVGSPTLNNGLFPTVSDFLTYMKGLKPKNKIGAAFGSYGWSGESIKLIHRELEEMKFNMMDADVSIKFVPDENDIKACFDFGEKIGKKLFVSF